MRVTSSTRFDFQWDAYVLRSHYKSWKFTGLLPWAALVFTAGYIMRELGAYHYGNVNIFISSICLVYAAP